MKRILVLAFLNIGLPTFYLNSRNPIKEEVAQSIHNGCEICKQKAADRKVGNLLTAMVNAKSREECKSIGIAYYNLANACNENECKVTDKESKEVLQKHELVDSEGNVKKEACKALEYIRNNPGSLKLVH